MTNCSNINEEGAGDPKSYRQSLASQAAMAQSYLYCEYRFISSHERLIRGLALRVAETLGECHRWLIKELNPLVHQIDLKIVDSQLLGGVSSEVLHDGIRKSIVSIKLGSLPVLLGCANRLLWLADDPSVSHPVNWDFHIDGPNRHWDAINNPLGMLSTDCFSKLERSIDVTLDAIRLLYFHEISHLLNGHFLFPPILTANDDQPKYKRAAECEADNGAGDLFFKYHVDQVADKFRDSPNETMSSIVEKLLLSGLCNYVSFQASYRTRTDARFYHYPAVRMQCCIDGARRVWSQVGGADRNFISAVNRNLIPTGAVFPNLIKGWDDESEEDSIEDRALYLSTTVKVIEEIKAKTVEARVAQWRYPAVG